MWVKRATLILLSLTLFFVSCQNDIQNDLQNLIKDGSPDMYYHWNSARAKLYHENYLSSTTVEEKEKNFFLYLNELLNAGMLDSCINELTKKLGHPNDYPVLLSRETKPYFDLLAIAHLRKGEVDNCLLFHGPTSCIVPFSPEAVHKDPKGSAEAIKIYKLILSKFPNDAQSRWLFNIAHTTLDSAISYDFGSYPLTLSDSITFPKFRNISANLGVDINGLSGGVSVDDFNNDGYLDIFTTSYKMDDQVRYFENHPDSGFIDKTTVSGLDGIVSGLNTIHADYNNDGYVDILVLRGGWLMEYGLHPNSLLKNNGDGTFTDVTYASGLTSKLPTQTASWGDFNRDGQIDLFIGNESPKGKNHFSELYKNNGDGTFDEISVEVGIEINDIVKGVSWGDINNDGWPELYISILGGSNKLFLNEQGKFKNIAVSSRVTEPQFSFPCWFWDFNQDGLEDIFVAPYDMRYYTKVAQVYHGEVVNGRKLSDLVRIYKNLGNNKFVDISREMGADKTMHAMGANFGDLNNDGYPDYYIGTGAPNFQSIVPNRMFLNRESNKVYEVTFGGGFGHLQKGHGIAFADFDNDGDQDIYNVLGGAYESDVFQNAFYLNPGFDANWISIDLEGTTSNKSAIGARIAISGMSSTGDSLRVYSTVGTGGSFGASSLRQEIGLGQMQSITSVRIHWPSGLTQEITNAQKNTIIKIIEGSEDYQLLNLRKLDFEQDQNGTSNHQHHEAN